MSTSDIFPVATLEQALPHLRRPVAPEAVHFKVQSEFERGGLVVGYIDARLVYERLNLVAGGAWSCAFDALEEPLRPAPERDRDGRSRAPALYAVCRLAVFGVTREDVGEGRDPKAAYSDAIKRAGVPFGIGRFLYAMRSPTLFEGTADNELRRSKGRKPRLVVDRRTERWLREHYAQWLERSESEFGAALGHGDDPEAVSEEEAGDPDAQAARAGSNGAAGPGPQANGRIAAAPGGAPALPARSRAGYGEQAVAELAAFLSDGAEPAPEALRDTLEAARAGGLGERELREGIARATSLADREQARTSFARSLARRASGQGAAERRAA